MKSSTSFQKRSGKNYFEEFSNFDLFFQLVYMSATAAAGISRSRTFQLARELACPPARFFKTIHQVAENLRYNYPDAVRLVGEQVPMEEIRTFLLRLSDALRSGEPLPSFLVREANVQGDSYENEYLRSLESLKQWDDAYTSVTVSAALIVIVNMVSTMIYNLGSGIMMMMVLVALSASFGVGWLVLRAAPQEIKSIALAKGSKEQRLSLRLFQVLVPLTVLVCAGLMLAGVDRAWLLFAAALGLLPIGIVSRRADNKTSQKDSEISTFLRSLGGTASSRGTTLKEALSTMKIDSFPALQSDIKLLDLRLKAFTTPKMCWELFRNECGSRLASQAVGIFFESINLGGDPEKSGNLASAFAMRTAMLRARRKGVAATFTWLIMVMHGVLAGLMVFLVGILGQFSAKLTTAMAGAGDPSQAAGGLGLQGMFTFGTPELKFLSMITTGMVVMLAVISAFAIVASEGSHMIKTTFYLSILFFLSALSFAFIPDIVKSIL